MENVFDIKREKNLNFILPINGLMPTEKKSEHGHVLIVIHLFYDSSLAEYIKYVENIPEYMDVLFTTSNPIVERHLKEYIKDSEKKYKFIRKENRGRDVSSLLIAGRTEILKYQYVCFLHDKKEKREKTKRDVELFVKCLWENMVGSKNYILNIIKTFEENPKLGVLLPPESISDNFSYFYDNTWYIDYELTESLIQKLGVNCDLDKKKKPLSLGTVFWARVEALKKLFETDWKYSDFDEEPLPADGTLSHGVERCFAYIAQDAGFETGIVMTDRFAGERMDYLQEIMTESFGLMGNVLGINKVGILKRSIELYDELEKFVLNYPSVYIYGAGTYGRWYLGILRTMPCEIKACIVSKNEEGLKGLEGISIIEVSQFVPEENSGVIVAVSEKFRAEILKEMKERYPAFKQIYCFGEKA